MRHLLAALLIAAVCALLPGSASAQKKYDMKSGIITFENNVMILGKPVAQKQILYFDEYGRKERKELYEGETMMEAYLSDGMNLFNLVFEESTAYRSGRSVLGTETRFDGDSLAARAAAKAGVTKLPAMKVAGRLCEAYEVKRQGATTVLAGWYHITLFTDNAESGIHSVSKAVEVAENVKVPPEKFRVPAGFKIK